MIIYILPINFPLIKMKKILYIFTLAALLCSCAQEQIEPERIAGVKEELLGYEHDGRVTFGFNPVFSGNEASGTKAMVEGADIKNLYVAVFDGSGYKLSEYIKAEPVTTGGALDNDTPYQYTIELKVSENKRILHFIANAPEELRFGSENEVIGELCTYVSGDDTQAGGFQNAYWQRLELENGIAARPKEGEDNYDEKLAAYNNVVSQLNGVVLIRNYSKVSLDVASTCPNFALTGFWFVNYPDRGTVAPYNRNKNTFVKNYALYPSVEALEADGGTFTYGPEDEYSIIGANYQGFMLQATEFLTPEFTNATMHAVSGGKASGYVYEREKALISPMYLIIKGEYYPSANAEHPLAGEHSTGFYKIAMQDNNGEFYAMLRNFDYLVRISSVTSAGKTSAEAALAGTPTGDISVNVDYLDIPNISDGKARMTVNQTTLMIIGPEGSPATAEILYKYEPDIEEHPGEGLGNEWVPEEPTPPAYITDRPYVTIELGEPGSTGAVVDTFDVSYPTDGFGHITITTTDVATLPKHQTVTITGKRYADGAMKTITRIVELVLRESLDMTLTVEPNTDTDPESSDYREGFVVTGTDKDVILNMAVEDNLPSSIFPLVFKIEPTNKTLTPDNAHSLDQDLPVRYGKDAHGYPTYWFEKSLNYSDYTAVTATDGIKTFPVWFKTILADSATEFEVSSELFNPQTAVLNNYTPSEFDATLTGSEHKVGIRNGFSFSLNKDFTGDVFITMKNFEPAPEVEGLVFQNTDSDGNRVYKKTLNGYTAGTDIPFEVIPYNGGVGSITLSAYLFDDEVIEVTNGDGSVISIDLADKVNGNVKSNVVMKSYGSGEAWIRAMIVGNWYDEDGNIVAAWDESQGAFDGLPGSGTPSGNVWRKNTTDGLYYYGSKVTSSSTITALFGTYTKPATPPVAGAHLELTIMVQAIPSSAGTSAQNAFRDY